MWAYFEDELDLLYDQDTRENGEILGVIECPDAYDGEDVVISSWNMYDINDFFDGKPPLETNVEGARVIKADDPEDILLTPNFVSVHSKRVNPWLNKAMTGFDKDVLIGSFDVYDGGYYYIAYTDLPDGISDEGFDVLYYGDNKNLVDREGVAELQVEETPIYDTGAAASDSGAAAGGLQVQAAPTNDTGVAATESGTAADELEGKIEEKYTAHLYAQWADSPAKAKASGKVPSTGDTMMPMVWAIVGIAVIAAAIAAAAAARLAFARRRR